jgi:hypothetical protein
MPVSFGSAVAATVVPSGEELVTGRQEESAAARATAADIRRRGCILERPMVRRTLDFNSGETTAETLAVRGL